MDSDLRGRVSARVLSRSALGLVVALGLGMIATPSSRAGGLYTNEFSTTAQANAGAGRGAWAPDASSTLHNPATMTELDEHSFATGLSLALADVHFDAESTSPSGTGDGGNQTGVAPIASFSYVHKVSDRVRFGLSFYSISGSILDPSNNWGGRFEMTNISLLTISIAPSLAFKVTDWLSVGGGPVANYGVLNWDLKVALPAGSESYVRLNKLDDWEPSGRVGILLKPTDKVALSVYFNSKTDYKLRGHINGPAGVTRSLSSDLPMAEFIEVNGYWQATEKFALLAIFDWENWSEANKLGITLQGPLQDRSVNATTGFKDTFKVGIGANYQLTDTWLLQTGVTYDTSALRNTDRTTALPIDDQIRFALGAQHKLNDSMNLGLSFVYLNLGQGEVRNATVRGDYNRNHAFILGMTLAFNKLPWNGKLTYTGDAGGSGTSRSGS